MKNLILLLILTGMCIPPALHAQPEECESFSLLKSVGQSEGSNKIKIAKDGGDHFFAAGIFAGPSIRIGGVQLETPRGTYAYFIARLDAEGAFLWVKKALEATSPYSNFRIAADPSGNAYFSTFFKGNVQIGDIPLQADYNSHLVAKISASGDFLWAETMESSNNYSSGAVDFIHPDSKGNLFVNYRISGTARLGTITLNSNGDTIYLCRLNREGKWAAAEKLARPGLELRETSKMFTDNADNLYIAGTCQVLAKSEYSFYLTKLNNSGNVQWTITPENVKNFNGIPAPAIHIDRQHNIFIAGNLDLGHTEGIVRFGNETHTIKNPNQGRYAYANYLAQIGTDGKWAWSRILPSTGNLQIRDVAADPNGNLVFSGNVLEEFQMEGFPSVIQSNALVIGKTNLQGKVTGFYDLGCSAAGVSFMPGLRSTRTYLSVYDNDHRCNSAIRGGLRDNNYLAIMESGRMSLAPIEDTEIPCGQSVTLPAEASRFMTVEWQPATGLDQPFILTPKASPRESITYTVRVTDRCGQSLSKEVQVKVKAPFSLSARADRNTITCGETVQLDAVTDPSVAGLQYQWLPFSRLDFPQTANPKASPGMDVTYTVKATDPVTQCSDSASVSVKVNNPDPPRVQITSSSEKYICTNGTTLSATSGMQSYEWSNRMRTNEITVHAPGDYSVIVYDTKGCAGSGSITLSPPAEILTPDGTVLCNGASRKPVTLTVKSDFTGFSWNTGDQSATIRVSDPGLYSCTVSRGSCEYASSVTVTESESYIPVTYNYAGDGLTVSFWHEMSRIEFLAWDFGDGNTGTDSSVTHTFREAGTYEVCLAATNNCAVTGQRCIRITVPLKAPSSVVQLPASGNAWNLFPNPGTGTYYLTNTDFPVLQTDVRLLDLAGKTLYRWNDYQQGQPLRAELQAGMYLIEIRSNGTRQKVLPLMHRP